MKAEGKKGKRKEGQETDSDKERKCAELRHARVMKLAEVMGYDEALSHWRENITAYELDWELQKALCVPPETRYQSLKKRWLWHESSWFMRRFTTTLPLTGYDGQGCNSTGCIPKCRFFEPIGWIEDDELKRLEEEEHKKEKEMIEARYRIMGFNDDDSDDIKRAKWAEIHELKSRILKQKLEYLEQRQHIGQSCDDLNAIEDAAWAEFYKTKNGIRITTPSGCKYMLMATSITICQ